MYNNLFLDKLGAISFLMLFPAFSIYHILLAEGFIQESVQNYLKGWFGPVSLVVLLLYSVYFFLSLLFKKKNKVFFFEVLFAAYIFYWLMVSIICLIFSDEAYIHDAFKQSALVLILSLTTFLVGKYSLRVNKKYLIRLSILFIAFYGIYVFINFDQSTLMIHTYLQNKDVDDVASYQGLARGLMILSFLIYCRELEINKRYLVILVCSVLLFLTGSRSEFGAFIICVVLFELLSYKWNAKKIIYDVSLLFFSIILIAMFHSGIDNYIGSSRISNLLNVSSDASYNFRAYLNLEALNAIKKNPIFGDFGYHFRLDDNGGMYAHSLISVYAQLGLIPFLILVLLIIISFAGSLSQVINRAGLSFKSNFSLLVNMSNLIMVLVSKSGFYILIPFGFGLYIASVLRKEK